MIVTAACLERANLGRDELRELERAAGYAVSYEFLGTALRAHFDDSKAAGFFLDRYRSMQSTSTPVINVWVAVSQRLGPVFWTDRGGAHRWPLEYGPRRLAFLADAVATKALFNALDGVVGFHAAAVNADGVAAAIAARSQFGKTTTAIACARRGMMLYSDERCVVASNLVVPFPRAINIRPEGVQLLREEVAPDPSGIVDRLPAGAGRRRYLSFEEILNTASLPPPAPLGAAFLILGRGPQPLAQPVRASDALTVLMKSTRSSLQGFERLARVASILDGVPCFGLTLGTPDETACLIGDTVRSLGRPSGSKQPPSP